MSSPLLRGKLSQRNQNNLFSLEAFSLSIFASTNVSLLTKFSVSESYQIYAIGDDYTK